MVSTKGRLEIAVVLILAIIVAVVVMYPHHVEVSAEGNGSVEPSDSTDIRFYQDLTIDIVPDDGYRSEVYVDGILKAEDVTSFTFNVGIFDFSSHSVEVVFVKKTPVKERYTLTMESTGDGSVSPSGSNIYDMGTSVDVSIAPSEGNVIGSITIDGVETTPSNFLKITMDSDHKVVVVFRPVSSDDISVIITVDVDVEIVVETLGYSGSLDFGTVTPSGTVHVAPHSSLTITVSLNDGFEVRDFKVNGTSHGAVTEYTVTDIIAPISVELSIVKKVPGYMITASASTGGSISPSGQVKVAEGEDVKFTFSPNSSYKLSYLVIDDVRTQITGSEYTFTDVRSAHTIEAVFTSTGGGGGDVPPTPSTTLTSISIERTPYSTFFKVGDTIRSLDGIVVRAHFSNGTYDDLGTNDISWTPTSFDSIGEKQIKISYTFNGVTKTCNLTVTILDETAFDVKVTSYHGTKVVDGSVVSFSQTGLSESLTGFTFDLNPAVPGITQTITLRIDSDSRLNLDAMLYVRGSTDEVLAKQILLTAEYNGQTASGTVFQLNGNTDGSFLNLGHVTTGSTVTVTVSFPHSEDNNSAMGHSLTFYLGVSAMEHVGVSE